MERVAYNPLPWIVGPEGFDPGRMPGPAELAQVLLPAGFTAVQADVPEATAAAAFGAQLADAGLRPAPAYFQADLADPSAAPAAAEAARRFAAGQRELGLGEAVLACTLTPERLAHPGEGRDADDERIARIAEQAGALAAVMAQEGVRACLHPHAGTWVETAEECDAVLAATDPSLLLLAPDNGHLAWAGTDPAAYVAQHAERVGVVHLKDFRRDRIAAARARGDGLLEAMQAGIWTEPGRGDADLGALLAALGPGFGGWIVIEVDLFDLPTPAQSVAAAGAWAAGHLADRRGW